MYWVYFTLNLVSSFIAWSVQRPEGTSKIGFHKWWLWHLTLHWSYMHKGTQGMNSSAGILSNLWWSRSLLFGLLDPLDGRTADINVNLLAGAANDAAKLWKAWETMKAAGIRQHVCQWHDPVPVLLSSDNAFAETTFNTWTKTSIHVLFQQTPQSVTHQNLNEQPSILI